MLSVNQLYFSRKGKWLFEDLSFELKAGEFLQIRGVNGAGKSSLLRVLAGYSQPAKGTVTMKGSIGYIGHEPAFTPWMTVQENVEFTGVMYRYRPEEISPVLVQFGLQPVASFLPMQLSQGQKRRLAFAVLSVSRAKLWLLDEPFTALDEEAAALVQHLVLAHLAAGGIVAMSTHQDITWTVPTQAIILGDPCALSVSDF